MPLNEKSDDLDKRLLAAHGGAGDNRTLSRLYTQAGDLAESQRQIDAACFYLTHAYVFALEQGLPEAAKLRQRLILFGREE